MLPREGAEAEDVIAAALTHDGVDIRRRCTVRSVSSEFGLAGSAILEDGTTVEFERMLVAVGKTPNTSELGLDLACVDTDASGYVVVTDTLRTSAERIWAAGDVTGLGHFTHTAGVNASIAAANAILGLRRTADRRVVPRVTFTQPEVAAVGIHDDDTSTARHRVVTVQHRDLDRAITESESQGFTRVVFDRTGVVIGATIVGPRAGESLAEVTLAVKQKMTASQLSGTTHPPIRPTTMRCGMPACRSPVNNSAAECSASLSGRWPEFGAPACGEPHVTDGVINTTSPDHARVKA
ncbi:FAD-dependent oxidoreductase [Glaciihabitans sp. UYNi722]|uniref:FAD-dependent oxidoreductase n=1 Tax=Glaciihabitans sp. UYNi722 TaxID=3156344 RepID=UPI00339117CF